MYNLNKLVDEIHETAKSKGWWDKDRFPLEIHMLIVSEIAEATEEVRKNKEEFISYMYYENDKPVGEAVELVDAVIRILDYFGHKCWDFEKILKAKMDYNKTRPYRHGGKKY